jgi:hypothetical protein
LNEFHVFSCVELKQGFQALGAAGLGGIGKWAVAQRQPVKLFCHG